jgi:hypothetical protein
MTDYTEHVQRRMELLDPSKLDLLKKRSNILSEEVKMMVEGKVEDIRAIGHNKE